MSDPYLALALSGSQLIELTTDARLLQRWDSTPVAFTVLGFDRIDGTPPGPATVSGTAAAAFLAQRSQIARFLVAASPQRDHPYNLARRVASLGHLSRGRSGLLVGVVDAYAPLGPVGQEAWGGANLGPGVRLDLETALAAARAVRVLEQGWPFDAFVGDRSTGILVQSDRIVHADIEGTYDIAGPLNLPEPRTGPSVIGLLSDEPGYIGLDLRIGAGGDIEIADADVAAVDFAVSPQPLGWLVRPDTERPLSAVLDDLDRWFASARVGQSPSGVTLREVLNLAAVPPLPENSRPAFGTPQPYLSL